MESNAAWDNQYKKLEDRTTRLRVSPVNDDQLAEINAIRELCEILERISTTSMSNEALPTPQAELARRKSLLSSLDLRLNELTKRYSRSSAGMSSSVSTNRDVVSMQRQAMGQQDRQLATLSKGLTDLKTQSLQISSETDLQARLLDDMDGDVDRLESAVGANVEQARRLKDNTDYSQLYWFIVALSVLLFVQIMIKSS